MKTSYNNNPALVPQRVCLAFIAIAVSMGLDGVNPGVDARCRWTHN